ncbi:MAG: hypothetical protein ACPG6V_12060 [Flavobacteriales bacterium]
MRKNILAVLAVLSLWSCKNDLEIYTEPQNLPYVYGLLEAGENVQYIHVAKSFQKIASEITTDDLYYEDDSVKVFLDKYVSGNLTNTWEALPVVTSDKQEGLFPFPYNKYYKIETTTPFVNNTTETYSIRVEPTNTANHVENKDKFALNSVINILSPKINGKTEIEFLSGPSYQPLNVKWNQKGGALEEAQFRVIMQEINQATSEVDTVEVVYKFYNDIPSASDDDEVNETVHLSHFYEGFGRQLKKDPNITRRMLDTKYELVGAQKRVRAYGVGLEVFSASKDFTSYKNTVFGVTGISQDKINWTNLENSLGIYTTRSKNILDARKEILFFGQSVLDSLSCADQFFDYNFEKVSVDGFGELQFDGSPQRCQ